jgi:hypothetical protein
MTVAESSGFFIEAITSLLPYEPESRLPTIVLRGTGVPQAGEALTCTRSIFIE